MNTVLASLSIGIATVCALLMGYAIQRGATCTVAAMEEIAVQRRAHRLTAIVEASLWVAGGLIVARAFGLIPALPDGFGATGWTVAGGIMLGLGAYINRACVFGAVARLGSGDWAYVLTPIGFFVGALTVSRLFAAPASMLRTAPMLDAFSLCILAMAFLAFVIWRTARMIMASLSGAPAWQCVAQKLWAPHEATILIGITFSIMFVTVGAWAYTDLLIQLAHNMTGEIGWRIGLFLALLVGAITGGWTAGGLSAQWPTWSGAARCFAGGCLMGWGSVLIPGSNDGLILIGLPLLWPYAWVAFLTMCLTIGIAIIVGNRLTTV